MMDIHAAVLGLVDATAAEIVVAVVGGLRRDDYVANLI